MREIKFRVFNTDLNKMIYPDETGWYDRAYISPRTGVIQHSQLGFIVSGKQKELVPMQYTGLKDVNGKEVYEGDILKYGYVVTYVDGSKGEDLGMNIGFYSQRDDFEPWAMLEAGEEIEVIGNIYESEDNQ